MAESFVERDLQGARFENCLLVGAVMRGVALDGADLDDPWLLRGTLLVNGVDVVPYVRAELEQRFPGYGDRTAADPAGLRAAYEKVQDAWTAAVDSAEQVDEQVDGEWSFAETLRHLVMATDVWLRGTVLGVEQPYHPLGKPYAEFESDGHDMSVFATGVPAYSDVLAVRAERVAMVRDFLATVTDEQLAEERPHPWAPERQVTIRHCLHTILDEEWSHLRFALRDQEALRAPAP